MEAIFIALFIGIILLKHFGAIARDAKFNMAFRHSAKQRGQLIYWGQDSPHYVSNNHKVKVDTDPYLGRIVTDLVTGKKYYQDLHELLDEYHKCKKRKNDYRDLGDVWYGHLGQTYGYVDKATEQIYFLACVDPWNDINNHKGAGKTYFYVDLNRRHVIRKTKKQMEKDVHPTSSTYTDTEIEKYVDKYADSPHGDVRYREADGRWIPQPVES